MLDRNVEKSLQDVLGKSCDRLKQIKWGWSVAPALPSWQVLHPRQAAQNLPAHHWVLPSASESVQEVSERDKHPEITNPSLNSGTKQSSHCSVCRDGEGSCYTPDPHTRDEEHPLKNQSKSREMFAKFSHFSIQGLTCSQQVNPCF